MSSERRNGGALEYGGRYVIAFANEKGGVGKTTSCVNVGAVLAQQGTRVLCIDLDPQANLTAALGIPYTEAEARGSHLLFDRDNTPLVHTVIDTDIENLTLVPASPRLATYEDVLGQSTEKTSRLLIKLVSFFAESRSTLPELVLLDCPPSLGVLTSNALVAATHMIVPVSPRLYSFKSMAQLGNLVATLHLEAKASVKMLGILVTLFDPDTSLDVTLYQLLKERIEGDFGDFLFTHPINTSVSISESEVGGKPVTVGMPKSSAARDYTVLAREVLARLQQDEEGTLGSFASVSTARQHV